ncbi:IS630 family transposase [Pleurocapsales cyanobacterium LEGE 10410]|nr:IS630 family transposase [Pleurocapsales cyanobacterium LEGE 10410]
MRRLGCKAACVKRYRQIRYWCQDESRIGLITLWARKLTAQGIQPVGIEQWCFDYLWLYGLVEPRSGDSFFAEFSHVDGVCFQQYLDWFAQAHPKQLHLIQLDNGRWHIWSELNIPDNIILIFQPPYSPQVNPIERLWKEIKKYLKWELFDNLDRLRCKLSQVLSGLTRSAIASITGWDFILDALFVANI